MSEWSIVVNDDATNQNIISNYRHQDSTTATECQYTDSENYNPMLASVNMGQYEFIGKEFTDQMCLY